LQKFTYIHQVSSSQTLVVNLPTRKMPKIAKISLPSTSVPQFQPITLRGPLKGKGLKDQGKFSLSQITAKKIVKMKINHRIGTCLRDKATIKLKCAIVVSTS
jgi:hypothetical protein